MDNYGAEVSFPRFWARVLFVPQGSLGRMDFCIAAAMVFSLGLAAVFFWLRLSVPLYASISTSYWPLGEVYSYGIVLISLGLYVYPLACICLKRMHDIGLRSRFWGRMLMGFLFVGPWIILEASLGLIWCLAAQAALVFALSLPGTK